jgi:hypothetical protein
LLARGLGVPAELKPRDEVLERVVLRAVVDDDYLDVRCRLRPWLSISSVPARRESKPVPPLAGG